MAVREGELTEGGGGAAPARAAPAERNENVPRCYARAADGGLRRDLLPAELLSLVRSERSSAVWVDIDSTNRHQLAVLEKVFRFHPLAIEDVLSPGSRPKLEAYDGYLFIVIRGIRFDEATNDPYDLRTFNLYFFLGPNYLVTVHAEPSRSIAAVAEQVWRSPDLLDRGPARLMHAIMDQVVDHYFPIIEQADEFIDGLEHRVFERFDQSAIHDVFAVKRVLLSLRRHLSPQREVFNILTNRPSALLSPDVQVYFRDVYDHALRITETIDTQRELLGSTMDAYLSQVSNRLGAVTKGLSVIATLSIPFVVISGMYGMNFERIPLARYPYGFWVLLGVQLGVGALLIAILRWRRWL
jgi:magnesium transporter